MFKKVKETGMAVTIGAMSVTMALAFAPSSRAVNGGGSGGNGSCVSGCALSGPFYWRYASSTPGGKTAWQKFAADDTSSGAGIRRQSAENQILHMPAVGMSNQELLAACQSSKMIWWVSAARPMLQGYGDVWAWNFSGKTYPSTLTSSFTSAVPFSNSSMNSGLQSSMMNFASKMFPTGKATLLCSNQAGTVSGSITTSTPSPVSSTPKNSNTPSSNPSNSNNPVTTDPNNGMSKPQDIVTTWNESKNKTSTTRSAWTAPYSYVSQITPQVLGDNGSDPVGKNNLHAQTVTSTETSFGALWDDMQSNPDKYKTMSNTDIEKLVNEAKSIDAKAAHNTVSLDDQNKAGMAEGGILNINQLAKNATINSVKTVTTQSTRNCTRTVSWQWDSNANTYVQTAPKDSCSPWQSVGNATPNYTNSTVEDATLEQTGFWQMLSVHCNKAQFEALQAAAQGATKVDVKDSDNKYSAVIYSKVYDTQPDTLDFGDANNPNKALAASASLGFYDKVCPFDCTSVKSGSGASSANGATSNVNNSTPKGGTVSSTYGALSGTTNNNYFNFFRDNANHVISTDVWYPQGNSVVSYKGEAPINTTIYRWAEGTPGLTDTSGGGKFSMSTLTGQSLFLGNDESSAEKDWSTNNTYSNSNATSLTGLQRSFNVSSTWASNPNKPQVFNFKWSYTPSVSTQFAADNVGFNADNGINGDPTTVSTPIQGDCFASYGSSSNPDSTDLLGANSGTGTTDNNAQNIANKNTPGTNNLFVNFLRATTE